jgi:hypothetical protein
VVALTRSVERTSRRPVLRHAQALWLRARAALDRTLHTDDGEHEHDHGRLLTPLATPTTSRTRAGEAPARLDVILVPTSRPAEVTAEGIARAADLAAAHGAVLVLLCSHAADVEQLAAAGVDREDVAVALLDVSGPGWRGLLPDFSTTAHRLARRGTWDTAQKRNLGLVMAAVFGWTWVLFLDDDLTGPERSTGGGLTPDAVSGAIRAMTTDPGLRLVGWRIPDFPDNSVVCHARRLADLPQGCFVGAGALLVRFGSDVPFFPSVYNEDWLFEYGVLRHAGGRRATIGLAGELGQQPYDPFKPARAEVEECGDVMAEGIFAVVGRGPGAERSILRQAYWEQVIRRRRRMIGQVRLELLRRRHLAGPYVAPPDAGGPSRSSRHVRRAALESLERAAGTYTSSERQAGRLAADIVEFFVLWHDDLRRWRKRMRRPPAAALHQMLADTGHCRLNAGAKHALRPPSDLVVEGETVDTVGCGALV